MGSLGVGASVVSALSAAVVCTVDRGGRRYQRVFVRGRSAGPMVDAGPVSTRGTTVTFVPDVQIFGAAELDRERVASVLGDLAVLNPRLRIVLDGAELPSYGGLAGYARALAGEVRREWSTAGSSDGIAVEIAVCWGAGPSRVLGWANQLRSMGSHVDGLLDVLRVTDEPGCVALIDVRLDHARFVGRVRDELAVPEVRSLVRQMVRVLLRG